jgi:glucosamine 6-phosphate synthetase-like amidotransferase/phosphosugar isomerase protein
MRSCFLEGSALHSGVSDGVASSRRKNGPCAGKCLFSGGRQSSAHQIDYAMPVIVLAPPDAGLEKTVSKLQEAAVRDGHPILIGPQSARAAATAELAGDVEVVEDVSGPFATIVYAAPVQLLAHHVAVFMGKDVDQPRNLARSVTVA